MSHIMRKQIMWFRTGPTQTELYKHRRFSVHAQTGWKKVEELFYMCSENKDADQLRSYCEADLCLWFRICKLFDF